jgi:hypothetical protein
MWGYSIKKEERRGEEEILTSSSAHPLTAC